MRKLATFTFPIKLDIGCGKWKKEGFIGMDRLDFGQEIMWDINHGIPLPDNSVSEVYSSHTVEHLRIDELSNFFQEVIRVAVNGANFNIRAPHSDDIKAHYLCHYSFWNENVIKGIVEDTPNLELVDVQRDSYHFVANLKIKK